MNSTKFKLTVYSSFLLILITNCKDIHAQHVSVSYYQSNISKIGLSYHFSERVRSEVRGFSYPDYEDMGAELIVSYDIVRKDRHRIYMGAGAAFGNYYEGLVLPFGLQFQPIAEFDRLMMHIELMPIIVYDQGFQNSLGIRYRFKE